MVGNSAYPYPNRLGVWATDAAGADPGLGERPWRRWRERGARLFATFDLRSPLYLGARTDLGPHRREATKQSCRITDRHIVSGRKPPQLATQPLLHLGREQKREQALCRDWMRCMQRHAEITATQYRRAAGRTGWQRR